MRLHSKTLFLPLVAVGLVLGALSGSIESSRAAEPGGAPRGVPVEAAEVKIDTVSLSIDAVGTLLSNESVMMRPEIAGRIVSIGFEEGRPIKKGASLVELDSSTHRAELLQAKATLALSRKNFERARELHGKGAGTARALDEAEAQLKVAEAAVVLAQAMLGKTTIRAPFGGIVGMRRISPGDYVSPGQDLVDIEEIDPIKVEFRVPEAALMSVKVGQELAVSLDAFEDRVFIGTVYTIAPRVDTATRSFIVRARIPNPDRMLRPGLFARVVLQVERRENAILVPEQAIVPIGNSMHLYRIVDGKAVMVEVTLGVRQNGNVEIRKGLEPGDRVVTAGQQKLQNGAPVMVVPSAAGA